MRAYLWSILMGSVANPVFNLLALGVGLGALIDHQSGGRGIGGIPYITFVGPALLASSAVTSAFEEFAFPTMGGFKWDRTFYAMNATTVSARQIVAGIIVAALARMVFTVTVFLLFLIGFGAVPSATAVLAIPAALLGGLALGLPVMAFAASLDEDDGWFALINRFIIAPMFLFSGTFYPLESLPVGLQAVGWVSPLWHATELGRMAVYGHPVAPLLALVHLLYPAALAALGLALAGRQFARRLAK